MESQTQTQELTIIDKSLETLKSGSEVLNANKTSVLNANRAAQALIDKINATGGKLTAETDKECMELLVKLNKTVTVMSTKRSPITQLMSLIAGEFTSLETQIDPKKPNTHGSVLQSLRNQYAKDLAVAERLKKEQAQNEANKNQEMINMKGEAVNGLNRYFYNYLTIAKSRISELFNSTTLETYDGHLASMMCYEATYPYSHFQAFTHGLYATKYHTIDDINRFLKIHLEGMFSGFADTFRSELTELQQSYIDKFPSKKAELTQIAQANEETQKELLEQQKRREEADQARIKQEEEDKLKAAEQKTESDKLAETTMSLFDQQTKMQVDTPAPETRNGYEITVTHNPGWMLIFQFWFTNEGNALSVEEAGKKSLNQMKAYCEKYAHKNNTKIESPFIVYTETFKAVNRKS